MEFIIVVVVTIMQWSGHAAPGNRSSRCLPACLPAPPFLPFPGGGGGEQAQRSPNCHARPTAAAEAAAAQVKQSTVFCEGSLLAA